jgi:formylglycine-generating enzyme required for sulfatase activity
MAAMLGMESDRDGSEASCCVPNDGFRLPPRETPDVASGTAAKDTGDVVWIPGGKTFVGTDAPVLKADGEGPRRRVTIRPYGLDRFAVSTERFGAFVEATGYQTDAERYGWSYVFHLFLQNADRYDVPVGTPWWRKVPGAMWSAPEGPGSTIAGRETHPVVHVSWNDAVSFAAWCGGRLPTEAEWEHAARGGAEDRKFPWGADEPTDEHTLCNIWQGSFPHTNTAADGYPGTAPVDSFAPNPLGLYNMSGNVWEWCADPFRVRSLSRAGKQRDQEALGECERVMKGGSHLCHISYCYRYRIAARMGRSADTSAGHSGFRVAYAPA